MHRVPCTSRVHSHRTRVSSSTTHTHTHTDSARLDCVLVDQPSKRKVSLLPQRMGIQAVSLTAHFCTIHMNIVVCENVTRHGHSTMAILGLGICGTGVYIYIYKFHYSALQLPRAIRALVLTPGVTFGCMHIIGYYL